MSALQTSTLLPLLGELSAESLGRWVTAKLAEAAALREHDAWLYPSDPNRMDAANRLHDAWRRWLEDAESLLARVDAADFGDVAVAGANELRDVVGWTGAMLQLSPGVIAERYQQAVRGEVYTKEEVRRALRLGTRR